MGGEAFGAPGIGPTWASSDKDFVTNSLGFSRLWATVGHGNINEVYWPSTGRPQIRDLGFYLLGSDRWVDLKRVQRYRLSRPNAYQPLVTIVHMGDDYQLSVEVLPDPSRDVLLLRYEVDGPYSLAVTLASHFGEGTDNRAWVDRGVAYAGVESRTLCLAADSPMTDLSVGYVGASDGWQDLNRHGRLTYGFSEAGPGNVAISAGLPDSKGVIALAFAPGAAGARTLALSSLGHGYEATRALFLEGWERWGGRVKVPDDDEALHEQALISATVLKTHEDRMFPGATVASLSTPWGNSTNTLGGYHLVWPRDSAQVGFAMLAIGQPTDARRMMSHMMAAQLPDGHWPQNYYPSGEPFWTGIQLDETALPILLAAKLREQGLDTDFAGLHETVRAAVGSIARTGPSSEQDRWEENPGINAFTLSTAIAALVAAAPWLDDAARDYALDLADDWNERIEEWTYVTGTPLAEEVGVDGYYVRIVQTGADGGLTGEVMLRNRFGETIEANCLVALDFSWLARLGLRAGDDPRIVDTVKVVDATLKADTPSGPIYRRYTNDGYGEYDDGRPYDGNGVGRAWPLLSGERGHLALLAGEDPLPYLRAIRACASPGGLLPEQVWDAAPIAERGLFPGRPSGSAMPLAWSHAEFLKLLIARDQGKPVEMLDSVAKRYGKTMPAARFTRWRTETPVHALAAGRTLLIEDRQPFTLHYGWDGWQGVEERQSRPQPFGLWGVAIEPDRFEGRTALDFTRRYGDRWENRNHQVALATPAARHLTRAHRQPAETA